MEPLPEVQFAINRYVDYLRKCTSPFWLFVHFQRLKSRNACTVDKKHWYVYGINRLALPTGFIGLAIADLIEPWCTFGPMD